MSILSKTAAESVEYGAGNFVSDINVPRETLERLKRYADLLEKWQKSINLVGPNTLPDLWRRHMLDSAQLLSHVPTEADPSRVWLDFGSGAGFPGLVIAIMTGEQVHLVESNGKKAAFLREVIRVTKAENAIVINRRIEDIAPFPADIITARAFAPLDRLLKYAAPFWQQKTVGLFLKGQHVDEELTEAAKYWIIDADQMPSRSDAAGKILVTRSISRVDG